MDDEDCAVCGREWKEKSLGGRAARLKINAPRNEVCWHRFCTNCIERKMMRQQRFECPVCGTMVKKSTLESREREDLEAERDATARRRVLGVFNKPRTAFASDREFGDYAEFVESLVFDLSRGGSEAKRVEEVLKKYQAEHAAEVARRASELAEKERLAAVEIKASRALALASAQRQRDEERRLKLDRQLFEKHQIEYELGDRKEAPAKPQLAPPRLTASDFPLPTPLETLPDRPKLVKGLDLDNRRKAANWRPDLFHARATVELLAALPSTRTPPVRYATKVQVHAAETA